MVRRLRISSGLADAGFVVNFGRLALLRNALENIPTMPYKVECPAAVETRVGQVKPLSLSAVFEVVPGCP
jgi:hypothetical protein